MKPPKSTDIAVYLGQAVTLDCSASGKPTAQISWILPDRTFVCEIGDVKTVLSPTSLLQNGSLQIQSPNFSSKGEYKCIASNAAGADTITYNLLVAALPPSIGEDARDSMIIQSGTEKTVKLYFFFFPKKFLSGKRSNVIVLTSKVLFCLTNCIQSGKSMYLHCFVKGEPPPTLKWTIPSGVLMKPTQFLGNRLFVFPNGTLYVRNVAPSDAGRYEV